MCGRYTLTAGADPLQTRFGVAIPFTEGTRRYNIAPTEPVVAIVGGSDGEQREARPMRWGLVPYWARELKIGSRFINARSETAAEKPVFRDLVSDGTRRVLLPADGWYEWLRPEDRRQPRQPFRFTVDDGAPFAFAGLWTRAKIDGERIESVTIMTVASRGNPVVTAIHHRMPVVLPDRESEHAWLDPGVDAGGARSLCRALGAERLGVAPVNPQVNRSNRTGFDNDGPVLLIAPAA